MVNFDNYTSLAAKYINNYRFKKMVNMLYMKPLKWISNDKKLNLQKIWIDDFNCQIRLENKMAHILYNVLDHKNIYSDEYANLDIKSIAKISKICLISFDENVFISFYGIDNILRTFYIDEEECVRCSSLFHGLEILYQFIDYLNIFSYEKIGNSWIIALPIKEEVYTKLNNNNIVNLLKDIIND